MEFKLVNKIQKLLALATSNNQNEAINALSKANALMLEYDITYADIESSELNTTYGEMVDIYNDEVTSQSKYKHLLFIAIGKLFKVCVMSVEVNPHRHKMAWIGRQYRVEIAIHTYSYLVDSIRRVTPKGLKGDDKKRFQLGAARNIQERIENMLVENIVNSSSQNSIVLVDYQKEIDTHLAEKFPGAKEKEISVKRGNQAGYDAANNISLNSHLNSSSSSNLRTLSPQK